MAAFDHPAIESQHLERWYCAIAGSLDAGPS
jgi:hypothetical protein